MCFKTRLLFDFRALCRPLQLGVICTVFYFIFQPGQDGQHSWNSLAFAPAEFLWRLTSNEPLIFSSYSICFFSGPFHLLNCFLMTNKPSVFFGSDIQTVFSSKPISFKKTVQMEVVHSPSFEDWTLFEKEDHFSIRRRSSTLKKSDYVNQSMGYLKEGSPILEREAWSMVKNL